MIVPMSRELAREYHRAVNHVQWVYFVKPLLIVLASAAAGAVSMVLWIILAHH
jgi:hypothetical protein